MLILAWIYLILSWFCDFALNTLDSELVLCLHLIYLNAGYCFWYQLYCLWHYTLFYTSVVSQLWVKQSNQKYQSRKISCFNLTALLSSKICHKNVLCVAGCCCCDIAMKMQQKCITLCVSLHLNEVLYKFVLLLLLLHYYWMYALYIDLYHAFWPWGYKVYNF